MTARFAEQLETAAVPARRRVYEQLWLELTIVGRDVWSRNDLEAIEKVKVSSGLTRSNIVCGVLTRMLLAN